MKKFYTFLCAALVACSASATDFLKFNKVDAQKNLRSVSFVQATAKKAPAQITPAAGTNFTISVSEITATGASVSITPAEENQTYLATVLEKSVIEGFEDDAALVAEVKSEMDDLIEYYTQYGYTVSYADFCYTGADVMPVSSLDPETEYAVIAYGIDTETAAATTAVEAAYFTTTEAAQSENVLTLTYEDGKLYVKTTTNDPWIYIPESVAEYNKYQADLSQESVNAEMDDWAYTLDYYGVSDVFTFTGDQTIDLNEVYSNYFSSAGLVAGTEYMVLAAGYADGLRTTDATYITFTYGEGEGETGGEDGQFGMVITVSDITSSSAVVSVSPSDNTTYYYFDVMTVDELMEYDGAADLSADYKTYFDEAIEYYAQYGYSLSYTDFASQGDDNYTFEDLEAGTYVAFAYAMDVTTGLATEDAKLVVKTFTIESDGGGEGGEVEPSDVTFDLAVTDITSTTATVSVTPSNDTDYYYFDILTEDQLNEYDGAADLAAEYVESFNSAIEYYAQYGYSLTIADFCSQGVDSYGFDELDPETKYVAFAYGIDPNSGAARTELFVKSFETGAAQMSDNNINMTYADGTITIETSNDDPFFFIMESLDEYEEYVGTRTATAEGVLSELQSWISAAKSYNLLDYFLFSGNQTISANDFWTTYLSEEDMTEGQYVAMACGYNGMVSTDAKFVVFDYSSDGITNVKVYDNLADCKLIKNGQVVIRHNNKLFNTKGIQVK